MTTPEPVGQPAASALPAAGPDVDRDLPLDSHLHTNLSPDSDVPIDAYCAEAVIRGIPEIAITDHVDFTPGAPSYAFSDFATRERTVREAAERWADRGLAVRFGIEVTYEPQREDQIRDWLAAHPHDFTIGSCHIGRESVYHHPNVAAWCAGKTLAEAVGPYFAEVTAAARSGLFDTIGHLDIVKRYLVPVFPPGAFAAAPDVYEAPLRALVDSGTGLEVNSSGLRQAAGETYPSPWVVARFRQMGGVLVTAGTDAHRIPDFAFGLAHAYAVAAGAGFEEVSFRRRPGAERGGDRIAVPERFVRARPATAPQPWS